MSHFMMVIWYPEYNENVLQSLQMKKKQIGEDKRENQFFQLEQK